MKLESSSSFWHVRRLELDSNSSSSRDFRLASRVKSTQSNLKLDLTISLNKSDEIDRFDEINQFDEFESRIDSTLSRSLIQNFVFATVFETSRSRSTSTSRFTSQNAIATSARRRTDVEDVLDDFAKRLRNASTTNVDRKRIRDANIQITHRKNIQARVAMNRARLKFEKKQYRNNQRAKRRQQTIAMRLRQNEIDWKRDKNDLTFIQNKIAIDLTNDDENIMNN